MNDEPIFTELPKLPERRSSDTSAILILIHELKLDMASRMSNFETNLKAHMTDETIELAAAIHDAMNKAFPNADAEAHKAYHAILIRKMESQTRLKEKLTEELTRWGLIGILSFVAYSTWAMFLKGPK